MSRSSSLSVDDASGGQRRAGRRYGCLIGALLLLPASALAAPEQRVEPPVPVFFAPLTVPRAHRRQAGFLRELLSARMVATGRFAETVTTEQEGALQACVRETNREANDETCWVRLGQGQGAKALVSGEVAGDSKSCDVVLRLTALETRLTLHKFVDSSAPCGRDELRRIFGRAARVLAGLPPVEPPSGSGPDATVEVPQTEPRGGGGQQAAAGEPSSGGGRAPGGEPARAGSGLRCPAPGRLVKVGRRQFCYHGERLSWQRAAARCAATGGQLARIAGAAENFAVHQAIGAPQAWQIWLGINDQSSEGTWTDEAGQAITYTHWAPNEPNDAAGGEDCATMLTHMTRGGVWWDSKCTERFPAVCQIPAARTTDCPGRVFPMRDRSYCVLPAPLLLHQAKERCASLGGSLAAPHDAVEQALFAEGVETATAWIGVSDTEQEGAWRHRDGTPVTHAPWGQGEPNDHGGNEDCAGLHTLEGAWNDDDCSAPRPYICSD